MVCRRWSWDKIPFFVFEILVMSRKCIKFYMLGCWGLSINFYLNVLNLIHQSYALLPQHHRRQTIFYFVTSNSVIKFDNDENKSERSENIIFKEIGNQWIFFRFPFSKKITPFQCTCIIVNILHVHFAIKNLVLFRWTHFSYVLNNDWQQILMRIIRNFRF